MMDLYTPSNNKIAQSAPGSLRNELYALFSDLSSNLHDVALSRRSVRVDQEANLELWWQLQAVSRNLGLLEGWQQTEQSDCGWKAVVGI